MRALTGGNAGFGDEDERAFDRLRLKLCDLLAAGDASQGGDPDRAKVPAELWGLLLAEAETFCKMITPAFSADHNFLLMSRLEEYSGACCPWPGVLSDRQQSLWRVLTAAVS